MAQGTDHYSLVEIWITIWIQEFFKAFFIITIIILEVLHLGGGVQFLSVLLLYFLLALNLHQKKDLKAFISSFLPEVPYT